MTFKIYTLGCKVNHYESQLLKEIILNKGFNEAKNSSADFCLINTCTVTHTADIKSIKCIRKAKKQNPNSIIVVTGCLAQNDKDLLNKEDIDFIIPQSFKYDICGVLSKIINPNYHAEYSISKEFNTSLDSNAYPVDNLEDTSIKCFPRTITDFNINRAFIKIQDGCDNSCTYCKVRLVRGKSVSRPYNQVLEEVKVLIDKGFKEFVFCGINLGSWNERDKKLYHLLASVIRLKNIGRIRLSSIEPEYIDTNLLSLISSSNRICRHLHIPFQSGSDRILKFMNKRANLKTYFDIIDGIKLSIPDCGISCDIIVGFPYEEDKDFQNTLKLLKKIQPVRTHIFPYSRREVTASSNYHRIPDEVLKQRVTEALLKTKLFSLDFRKTQINKNLDVIFDNNNLCNKRLGYTDNYIRVQLDSLSSLPQDHNFKDFLSVRLIHTDLDSTIGRLASGVSKVTTI